MAPRTQEKCRWRSHQTLWCTSSAFDGSRGEEKKRFSWGFGVRVWCFASRSFTRTFLWPTSTGAAVVVCMLYVRRPSIHHLPPKTACRCLTSTVSRWMRSLFYCRDVCVRVFSSKIHRRERCKNENKNESTTAIRPPAE